MGRTIQDQLEIAKKETADLKISLAGAGPEHPMYYVNQEEANEFCRRLTAIDREAGRLTAAWEYRLPTEAQWEYACRAGTSTRYCFGGDEDRLVEYAWFGGGSERKTMVVGQKKPNGWNIHDMHGNVSEWCADIYEKYLRGGRDPQGGREGEYRVDRGGSAFEAPWACRSAHRPMILPATRSLGMGFRVALVPISRDR